MSCVEQIQDQLRFSAVIQMTSLSNKRKTNSKKLQGNFKDKQIWKICINEY